MLEDYAKERKFTMTFNCSTKVYESSPLKTIVRYKYKEKDRRDYLTKMK